MGADEWVDKLVTIATSSGLTAGGLLALTFLMLSRGVLWVNRAVEALLATKDAAIEAQKEQYEQRIAEIIAGKNEAREVVEHERDVAVADRDTYRDAVGVERARGDAAVSKVMDEVVPLIRVTNAHLDAVEKLAREGGESP